MVRLMAVLLVALAGCGGGEAARCEFRRATTWDGPDALVEFWTADGLVAWCVVPGGRAALAACADVAGNPVTVARACVEDLPMDARPRG